jgi:hypothetical protein
MGFWLKPDSDVVRQIAQETARVAHLHRYYVKGHQDLVKNPADLTQPEIYNIDADKSATKMRYEMTAPATRVIPFPMTLASLSIQQQTISSVPDQRLHEQFTRADYWDYMCDKYHWTEQTRKQ